MIKSCVIGLSRIGQIHCKNLIRIKKTSLRYVYDSNYNLSNKISKKLNCKTSKNFDSILKKKDIKLFIIASPTISHEFYIKKLIKFKKHIYCEKPIVQSNKNLKKIYRLIKKSKIKFGVGLNRRYSKEYVILKKKTQNKKINIIQIISRSSNHNIDLSLRNGGLFFDKGFHFFDLACWLGKSVPEKMIVISKSISNDDFLKKGDFSDAVINMRLKNGIIVEFIFSRKCKKGNFEKIKVYGKNFSFDSDKYSKKKSLFKDYSIRHKESYFKCLNKFLKTKKKEHLLEEGILAQKICNSALIKAKIQ